MTSADVELSNSVSTFSTNLYLKVIEGSPGNVILSPLSIQIALALIYIGARGETESKLRTGLHLPATDRNGVSSKFEKLIKSINLNPAVKIANKIYVQKNLKIAADFNKIAEDKFDSATESVDFSKTTETSNIINKWVESKTNYKIHDLITPNSINGDTKMVLVNAIYFKGDWLHKFDPNFTKPTPFWKSESESSEVDMMNIEKKFKYGVFEDLDATAVELPFTNNNVMLVVLPNKRTGLPALEEKLKAANFSELSRKMSKIKVALSLPKFKIEYSLSMKKTLEQMGMSVIFSNSADFGGLLTSPEPLHISDVIHKAFIEVNENGAEAVATTRALMMSYSAVPRVVNFKADHSFVYVLRDDTSKSNLFVGRYTN